jgi:hypothetical protein
MTNEDTSTVAAPAPTITPTAEGFPPAAQTLATAPAAATDPDSLRAHVAEALDLPCDATPGMIMTALASAADCSAANYLLEALPSGFADLTEAGDVEVALRQACADGSATISRAFIGAINEELINRWSQGLDDRLNLVPSDLAIRPFNLARGVCDFPWLPPFECEEVRLPHGRVGHRPQWL